MQSIIGILFFIFLPALISVLLDKISFHMESRLENFISYCGLNWMAISAIKTALGECNISILKSFEENGLKTYVHYAVPIVALSVLEPIAVRFICKKTSCGRQTIDRMNIATIFIFSTMSVMQNWVIQNGFVLTAGIVLVVRLVLENFKKEKNENEKKVQNRKKTFLRAFLVIFFWAMHIIIFIPGKIYLSNVREFQVEYSKYIAILIIGAIIISVVIALGTVFVLNTHERKGFLGFVFGYTLCGYLQQNFFNGKLIQLDGQSQVWTSQKMLLNIAVWIIVIVISVLIALKKHGVKRLSTVAAYIQLILIFTLVYLSVSTELHTEFSRLTNDKVYELDDTNNTIVFILDWYDEQVLEQIVDADEDFLLPLEGFTWYKNQTSRYTFTYLSVPYLLSGTEWCEGQTEEEYADYAFDNGDFLKRISDAGYDVGIYTDEQMVRDKDGVILNYENGNSSKIKFFSTISVMSKCAKYETMPFCLKNIYWYNTSDIDEIRNSSDYDCDNERFYYGMKENGITIRSDSNRQGAFRFYHIDGIHDSNLGDNMKKEPVDIMTCGRNVLRIVFEYIDMMKTQGVYDNSTIIITADHGQNYLDSEWAREGRGIKNTSNPILLVKEAGANKGLEESLKPVSHDNYFSTVLNSVGGEDYNYAGSYENVGEEENAVRYMDYYRSSDIPHRRYRIEGIATEENSWTIVE